MFAFLGPDLIIKIAQGSKIKPFGASLFLSLIVLLIWILMPESVPEIL